MVLPSLLLFALLCTLASAQTQTTADGLVVGTKQGQVAGRFVGNSQSVRQFLGIPYAVAKRWKAPTSPPAREGVFNASSFIDSCPQQLTPANLGYIRLAWTGRNDDEIFIPNSESCLGVNIWAPSTKRKQSTAVLVWIHGGGFGWGSSNLAIYNGTNIVQEHEDITLVSFNYRLNIFSQPNAPQLLNNKTDQVLNFGLLDQRAAIEWVHDNIASFGGDPERITIFGQSAGGSAVDAQSFAHPNDTIVKGLIEQSGNVFHNDVVFGSSPNTTSWNNVADLVGCGKSPTAAQFSCMEKVPSDLIEKVTIDTNAVFPILGDDITYPKDTQKRSEAGHFLKVPLLIGSALNERDPFLVAQELVSPGLVLTQVTTALSDIQTIIQYPCPENQTIDFRLDFGVPVFRYQYQATNPNFFQRQDLRAFHGSEIALVFGTYNHTGLPPGPSEVALSKTMQNAWVQFARNPARGLLDLGWPTFNPSLPTYVQIGNVMNASGILPTSAVGIDKACADLSALNAVSSQLLSLIA